MQDRDDAIDYVNELIARELGASALSARAAKDAVSSGSGGRTVLDLGCGVGGSMFYLEPRIDAELVGVTVSGVQADLGRAFAVRRGASRIHFVEADFVSDEFLSSMSRESFDAAIAVESFIHVDGIVGRLASLARLLRRGGTLIVVDDMISRRANELPRTRRERRWLAEFRRGWHAHGLAGLGAFVSAASEAGLDLAEARDLTPYLELDRPRDLIARAVMGALRWLPLRLASFENLLGGNALQLALKRRLLGYYYLTFTARGSRTSS